MFVDNLMTGPITVKTCPGNLTQVQCWSQGYVINVSRVELGEACLTSKKKCRDECNCTRPPSDGYMNYVYSQCNGRQSCDIKAASEKINGCGGNSSEFERITVITYNCVGRFQWETNVDSFAIRIENY